jgi:hypothetical protein
MSAGNRIRQRVNAPDGEHCLAFIASFFVCGPGRIGILSLNDATFGQPAAHQR